MRPEGRKRECPICNRLFQWSSVITHLKEGHDISPVDGFEKYLRATSDPAGQSVLYATASEALIGEELFAAPVYLAGTQSAAANLVLQDILRWLIILGLLLGSALSFLV